MKDHCTCNMQGTRQTLAAGENVYCFQCGQSLSSNEIDIDVVMEPDVA